MLNDSFCFGNNIARLGYHGLFGEIKTSADEVYTKTGCLRQNEHIREQAAVIEWLRLQGYKADFWCGFEHARGIIDKYLEGIL